MPAKKPNDEQAPKKGRKKALAPEAAAEQPGGPAESFLSGPEVDESGGVPAAGEPSYEQAAATDARAIEAGLELIFGRGRNRNRSFPNMEKEPREDVSRNRAKIRRVMLDYIKNELRAATTAEICEATGLSDKTVKAHKKHIKLGDGSKNIYQELSHDVVMSLYKKAKGFHITGEKLLTVAGPKGEGSSVERHDIRLYHAPDVGAAKLWFQAIEGMSDKTETKHSGEVGGGGGFHFEYVAPQPPANE
jgi:hypothetical protein